MLNGELENSNDMARVCYPKKPVRFYASVVLLSNMNFKT